LFFSLDLDVKVFLHFFLIISQTFLCQSFSHQFFSLFKIFFLKIFPNFFNSDLDAKCFFKFFRIILKFFLFQIFFSSNFFVSL